MAVLRAAPLSMEDRDVDDEIDQPRTNENIPSPLDDRVIQVIQACKERTKDSSSPSYIIRPARLAAELGLSVEDACAELCGLLAAVGGGDDGARFQFEQLEGRTVMVFHFPLDFATKALRKRRKETFQEALHRIGYIALRVVQIVTALGLILSLLILCIAAIAGLIAAIVALSRSGNSGRNETQRMMHQVRSLFFTTRQLLWCFALLGPDDGGEGSFYREIAYDISLCLSVCCGNPMSAFYWMRVNQLSRRRQRAFRGWGGRTVFFNEDAYGVEGVSLVLRGDRDQLADKVPTEVSAEYRGLLSVAVEFLFGQTPFNPGPSDSERWQMRAAFLVKYLSSHSGVPLSGLMPYANNPPLTSLDTARTIEQGLLVVAHFNGIPTQHLSSHMTLDEATFTFPELLAESEVAVRRQEFSFDEDDVDWQSILYKTETARRRTQTDLPGYLKEFLYHLTFLPFNLFLQCLSLGMLNLVGVFMLGPSLEPGGMLELRKTSTFGRFILGFLMPVLRFYAVLFFALPASRLVVILVLNARRRQRNKRREALASELSK